MSQPGSSNPNDCPLLDCDADGATTPGRSVVDAVECGSARFLTLTHSTGGVTPTYLVLTAADTESATALSTTDVLAMPELQNALAFFGPDIESVRVQTQSRRRAALQEHVDALRDAGTNGCFEFGGRQFDLEVVLG